jgi:hypothetical protein
MIRKLHLSAALILLGLLFPVLLMSQADGDPSLGDLARSLRKSKAVPDQPVAAQPVIDNDNLSKVMEDAEAQRLKGLPVFSIDEAGKNFEMKSPDGTCSLSFNANATALITTPYVPQDLPQSELMKLDGPATIENGTLQVSIYNGTAWDLKEVTVGLTIVRPAGTTAEHYGPAKLLPAVEAAATPDEKRSDMTMLYHLKGAAAPFATTIFEEALSADLAPDQEWHWAIVQAQGIPPKPVASAPDAPTAQ